MKIHLLMGASALGLGACAYEPTPLPSVATQQAVVNATVSSPISYQDPLAGYTYRGPTGPVIGGLSIKSRRRATDAGI